MLYLSYIQSIPSSFVLFPHYFTLLCFTLPRPMICLPANMKYAHSIIYTPTQPEPRKKCNQASKAAQIRDTFVISFQNREQPKPFVPLLFHHLFSSLPFPFLPPNLSFSSSYDIKGERHAAVRITQSHNRNHRPNATPPLKLLHPLFRVTLRLLFLTTTSFSFSCFSFFFSPLPPSFLSLSFA